jgi:hypothetical protein
MLVAATAASVIAAPPPRAPPPRPPLVALPTGPHAALGPPPLPPLRLTPQVQAASDLRSLARLMPATARLVLDPGAPPPRSGQVRPPPKRVAGRLALCLPASDCADCVDR